MAQTYKFGRGTWATKEGSTLAYNDENENYKPLPFNFERDSIATRVNKEGLIEVVGNDIPRIDYTDSADGVLLLENSSTNRFLYSEDLTQFDLSSSGTGSSNPVVTSNYGISPDGTQNADRVQLNAGTDASGNSRITETFTIYATTETISVYLKSNDGQEHTIDIIQSNSPQNTATVTSEWKRFSFTNVNTSPDKYGIGLTGSNGETADILAWGFQLEQNSFATSYIPTSGSTVQRAAETANGSGNSEVFNDSEGVLFADISALDNDLTNRRITISDPSGQNFVMINYTTTTNQIAYSYYVSGVYEVYLTENISKITNNTKISVSWSLNKFQMYINGFLVKEQLSGNLMTGNNLDNLRFSLWNGNNPFYGKTKELGYYDTALTDEELEYMTSYRSLNELVTELNLNTL
jgi:hypothetical protein